MKIAFSLGFVGMLFLAGIAADTSARAETVPQLSANRVIQLAPINSAETMPVVSSVALDPAGKLLAAVGDDHLVRVFDLPSGKVAHRWASHADWVKASAFRPNGSVLATSGADRRICFWHVMSEGKTRSVSEPLQAVVYTLAYSPDGRFLAAAGFADKVWMFDAEQGKVIRELSGPGFDIRAIAFSPDGTRMAAAGRSGLVRIWDAVNGQQIADSQVSSRRIRALAYSPDGKLLAAAGQQRTVRLLDSATGKPRIDLPERPGDVRTLCFCGPDTLASAGSGNVIHLWNIATRKERTELVGHTGSITTLVFNRSEEMLISGSYDTTVRLWDVKRRGEERITQRR
jgi:WD40 repeat protein